MDVLAELSEHVSGDGENFRLATGDPKRPPGKIHSVAAVRFWVLGLAVNMEIDVAPRGQNKGEPVVRIAFDCLPEQLERVD